MLDKICFFLLCAGISAQSYVNNFGPTNCNPEDYSWPGGFSSGLPPPPCDDLFDLTAGCFPGLANNPFSGSVSYPFAPSPSFIPNSNYPRLSPLEPIREPDVYAPETTIFVEVPAPPRPRTRVLSNKCTCKKTVVQPQTVQRVVKYPTNVRLNKKFWTQTVERIPYSARGRTGLEPASSRVSRPSRNFYPKCDY